jgi:UDP-GlcNAc3NAcA epimerase
VLECEQPDWLLVYGDTNSTLAGALAAAKLLIPIAHVEAGVRSYNRAMPEEVNRVLTDHTAALLFCPTQTSVDNLRHEGITEGVHHVGDVMYDALLTFLPLARQRSAILRKLNLPAHSYALLTLHRAENVDSDDRLTRLVAAIRRLDLPVVFPAHPRARKRLETLDLLAGLPPQITVLPPVGYLDMLLLQSQALTILTDSGGVQREAHYLSVPSVILRRETEWPELVASGASRLVGDDFDSIVRHHSSPIRQIHPCTAFGTGDASQKIVRQMGLMA